MSHFQVENRCRYVRSGAKNYGKYVTLCWSEWGRSSLQLFGKMLRVKREFNSVLTQDV